jgi:hypothetical protein
MGMRYILNRLKEASTWAGISALLSVVGVALEPEFTGAIAVVGTTLAGLALALLPDGSTGKRAGE